MADNAETASSPDFLSDEEIVAEVLRGKTATFEIIMRRHNQRLYRVARAILRNDAEAEDVMQDAYVRAYEHLEQFAGKAKFSTWLTRIAVHEALSRKRRGRRYQDLEPYQKRTECLVSSLPLKAQARNSRLPTPRFAGLWMMQSKSSRTHTEPFL